MTETLSTALEVPAARELLNDAHRSWLVDVRTPGEFAAAHVPGSYNVPLDQVRAHAAQLSTEDPIVLLCASGDRAEQARTVLTSAPNAAVVRGGIAAWEREGAPVSRGSGTWSMERQVRFTAGLLVLLGVLGSLFRSPLRWVAGFIGAGLTFSGVTNTCGMARVLSLLPHNRSRPDDTQGLLADLSA